MAVPKRKTSKAKRDQRRASNFKLEPPNLSECPQCHALKPSHIVCKACGYYAGKQVVEVADEKRSK